MQRCLGEMGQAIPGVAQCSDCAEVIDRDDREPQKLVHAHASCWQEEALVTCQNIEDRLQQVASVARRGRRHVSEELLVNHELLQHARQGNLKGINEAIEQGACVDTRRELVMKPQKVESDGQLYSDDEEEDIRGMTALMFAAQSGSVECVQRLVHAGANANAIEEDWWSPLHFAAKEGHLEVCKVLVQAGANPSALNCDDKTPLHLAKEVEDDESFAQKLQDLVASPTRPPYNP